MDLQRPVRQAESIDYATCIPLFPLPNAVLLPKAILPLHIFEERYRIMTADALSGSRLIALAMLGPGYEATYHTLSAPIQPVVCVGRILREEQLPDGRFNFLLQGLSRARVVHENRQLRYRRAMLQPEVAPPLSRELEYVYRHEVRRMLNQDRLLALAEQAGWIDLLQCPELSLSDLLDVLASLTLQSAEEKQKFLEESDVGRRAKRMCAILSVLATSMEDMPVAPRSTRRWPPVQLSN